MKTHVKLGLCILAVALAITSGAVAQSSASAKTKITMWSQFADPNSKDSGELAFFKALDATKAKFPNVEIEHLGIAGEAYKNKIQVANAANELPDIFFCWGGGRATPFISSNRVLALDSLLKDGTMSRIVSGTTDNFVFSGKTYGLPLYITTANLYVNKELFAKVGAKIPATWEDLTAAVKAFNAKGITPIAMGAKDRWPAMFWNAILAIRTAGAKAVNAALTKTGSFGTADFVAGAKKYKELIDLKAFGPSFIGTSYDDANNLFFTGKAGMLFMGGWINSQIEDSASLVKGGKIVPIKFPVIAGGKGNADEWFGGSGETFFINANVKNQAAVWEVYKFFMETMGREAYLAGSGAWAWKGDPGSVKELNPQAAQIGQLSASATGFSYWWDQMLNSNDTETFFGAMVKFLLGKSTPDQYVNELQTKISAAK